MEIWEGNCKSMGSIRDIEGNSGFTARDKSCELGFALDHGAGSFSFG